MFMRAVLCFIQPSADCRGRRCKRVVDAKRDSFLSVHIQRAWRHVYVVALRERVALRLPWQSTRPRRYTEDREVPCENRKSPWARNHKSLSAGNCKSSWAGNRKNPSTWVASVIPATRGREGSSVTWQEADDGPHEYTRRSASMS